MVKSIVCVWQKVSVGPQTDRCGYVAGLARIREWISADTCADWRGYVDGLAWIRGRIGADTWTD